MRNRDSSSAEFVGRIVEEATRDHAAWELLAGLTDGIGPRPAGSPQAAEAILWAGAVLSRLGIRHWTEEVVVPHWQRGVSCAAVVAPVQAAIALLALGGSIPTAKEGFQARVVMVRSLEEIDGRGDLAGSIVVMNRPMDMTLVQSQRSFEAYRAVAPLRVRGPSIAARQGALAYLIRSLGSASWRLPHAGHLVYDPEVPPIPAAAIAAEDADLIERLLERGEVTLSLRIEASALPEETSANVVAEIPGQESGEVVLIGAHLDSWDVSPGAHDNGSGVAMVLETLRLLSKPCLRPKRTVRAVLFMNEENGGHGGRVYHDRHRDDPIIAVAETDHGAWAPIGFDTTLSAERWKPLLPLIDGLESLGAFAPLRGRTSRLETHQETGVDTALFRADGVPGFALMPEPLHYFDLHHTAADTLDKVDPDELSRCVAAFCSLVWMIAETGLTS